MYMSNYIAIKYTLHIFLESISMDKKHSMYLQ